MKNFEGTNFIDFKRELLKDSKTRTEYERLKPKYELIQALIKRRNEKCISQAQLARIIGTKQPAICRLERGDTNVTLATVFKVVEALDLNLQVLPEANTISKKQLKERL